MRRFLAGVFLVLATDASASDCSKWTASQEEGEGGGSRMVARTCNAAGGQLTVECGEPGSLNIAWAPKADFAPPNGNPDFVGPVSVATGGTSFQRDMTYWAMDGVMGAVIPFNDGLLAAIKKAEAIEFASASAGIVGSRFSLHGAAAALRQVEATCPRR